MIDYYGKGTVDKPVISNSALSTINPEQGGSIRKFLNFFNTEEEKKSSLSMEKGKLVHKYIEDKDKFAVADFTAPTEMMANFIEDFVTTASNLNQQTLKEVDVTIASNNKIEKNKQTEILETRASFEKLASLTQLDVDTAIKVFRVARRNTNAYKSQNEGTLLGNIVSKESEIKYLQFLKSSINKIVLTADQKRVVENCTQSLFMHPFVSVLLGLREDELEGPNPDEDVHKELPIFWEYDTPVTGLQRKILLQYKALIDRLVINHKLKTIKLIDLKTTAMSLYLFTESFEKYRYYRQMAFYSWAVSFWFKLLYPTLDLREYKLTIYIVPVETTGLYLTGVYNVSQAYLYKGTSEFRSLSSRFAWHKVTGEYNYSYEEAVNNGILELTLPKQWQL